MASILWNYGEQSIIDSWLLGGTTFVPAAGSGNFGVGLGAMTGAIVGNPDKARTNNNNAATGIAEIGQTGGGAGYARYPVQRSATGWPTFSLVTGDWQATSVQAVFNFSGAPNLNGATLWFLAKATTIAVADCLFGADLAATRTFGNGDSERITITYRQQ